MGKIITITNQKGGAAKTTTAVNLAYALSTLGKQTLIIDLDPQGNASRRLRSDELQPGISDVIMSTSTKHSHDVGAAIHPVVIDEQAIDNLFVLPTSADRRLAVTAEQMMSKTRREELLQRLMHKHREAFDRFDYIIIDTNPALNVLTMNAMIVADCCVIPTNGSAESHGGAWSVVETLQELLDLDGPDAVPYKILRCDIDRRTPSIADLSERLTAEHGTDKTFRNYIPRNVKFEKSVALRQPLGLLYPDSDEAGAFKNIAMEMLDHD